MVESSSVPIGPAYLFGPFRLVPAQHLLLEGQVPVRLGSRALEILTLLVEQAGALVSKHDLMAHAWPRTVVEEGNLKVAVASLRRALGDGRAERRYLVNIPGRGYQFVAPVQRVGAGDAPAPPPHRPHNLPCLSTRVIGRCEVVACLADLLEEHRLVTIAGPGGIGKTTVALAIAQRLVDRCEHGVRLVDLATLSDPGFVPIAVAKALGVIVHAEDVTSALVVALRERPLLLVLDSCERVLQATAELVDRILAAAPGVRVLATSREPLRVPGERLHRLAPLAVPPMGESLSAADAMAFPAVALFVERASACIENFSFTDADAPVVADICRKLEGIALAIELTATRVDAFALRDLSALLANRFRLLNLERRIFLARHSSLCAALDWSHEVLPLRERLVLRRVAVFPGSFTLDSAIAVARGDCDVVDAVDGLVAKSLVVADVGGQAVRYRLLDATRAYATNKLAESGERSKVRRRHAEHLLEVLTRAEQESHERQSAEWLADHGRWIDDVRSAIAWAISDVGDAEVGVALTIAAIPLWAQLSLLDECRATIERTLAADAAGRRISLQDRMKLQAALGVALLYTQGPRPEILALWTDTLHGDDRAGRGGPRTGPGRQDTAGAEDQGFTNASRA